MVFSYISDGSLLSDIFLFLLMTALSNEEYLVNPKAFKKERKVCVLHFIIKNLPSPLKT